MGMPMGTTSAAEVGAEMEGERRPVLAHRETSRFLGYRLGMTKEGGMKWVTVGGMTVGDSAAMMDVEGGRFWIPACAGRTGTG